MKLGRRREIPELPDGHLAQMQGASSVAWDMLRATLRLPFGRADEGVEYGNCTAQWDTVTTIDPTAADVVVTLPRIRRQDIGRAFYIATVSGSTNAVVLRPVDGALVNGQATFTVHQLGYSLTFCMVVSASDWIIARLFTETRSMLTPEGGTAVRVINKTGSASVKGTVVGASSTTDDAFETVAANGVDPIGAVYENGVADGDYCWIVRHGRCQVLLEDSTAATRDYWAKVSDTQAGRADITNAAPPGGTIVALEDHFSELGHGAENVSAGTDKLAYIWMHQN